MTSELRPGWYWVTHELGMCLPAEYETYLDLKPTFALANGQLFIGALGEGWTLGPRIDDLLRDAERYRWVSGVSTGGLRTLNWDSKGTGERSKLIDAEIARESK